MDGTVVGKKEYMPIGVGPQQQLKVFEKASACLVAGNLCDKPPCDGVQRTEDGDALVHPGSGRKNARTRLGTGA